MPISENFSPKRILVCQQRQIGDVLLATPAIELLKKRYPSAELHVFTEEKCAPMLWHNPYINKIWSLDKKALQSLWQEVAWYWKVARTGFDLIVDFQQLPRCRWIVAFSRSKIRLTFTPPWYNRSLYTHFCSMIDGYAAMSKASILRELGIHYAGERPKLCLTEEERTNAAQILQTAGLKSGDILITVDATHRYASRRWPVKLYAETLHLLAKQRPELRFFPFWGPGEEKDVQELIRLCPDSDRILRQTRTFSLREVAGCIAMAKLHLGNCSAPRHIAVAVDTPSCVVLGSSSDGWTFPSPKHTTIAAGLDCQPCKVNTCPKASIAPCLNAVSPQMVAERVLSILQEL